MDRQKKVRILRKLFRKIDKDANFGYEMSMKMSGRECSAEISSYFTNLLADRQKQAFTKIGLDREVYEQELNRLMPIEASHLSEYDYPKAYQDWLHVI